MDCTDIKNVVNNLQNRPIICSENYLELDNGYIITTQAHYHKLISAFISENQPITDLETIAHCRDCKYYKEIQSY